MPAGQVSYKPSAAALVIYDCVPHRTPHSWLVEDHAAAEDVAAAEPGLPFTETEDDEEWINWVNWAEVEAQTGGTSSS